MSDEVETFFKSKKKVAAKKLGAQTPDMLGRHLELTVLEQENNDLADEEWKLGNPDRLADAANEGDSEWLDVDENPEFDLPGLKNLDIDNGDLEDVETDDNAETLGKQKAWNFEENAVEVVIEEKEEVKTEEPTVYVPPSMKVHMASRVSRDVNLTSADEFPSLSTAENISKTDTNRKKRPAMTGSVKGGQVNAWSRNAEVKGLTQHIRQVSDFIEPALMRKGAAEEESKAKSRYVPPHLRK